MFILGQLQRQPRLVVSIVICSIEINHVFATRQKLLPQYSVAPPIRIALNAVSSLYGIKGYGEAWRIRIYLGIFRCIRFKTTFNSKREYLPNKLPQFIKLQSGKVVNGLNVSAIQSEQLSTP